MNEHLNPVLDVVIPTIQNDGIRYWVYGGVAAAGINGEYLRDNSDVDIFVMSEDYDRTIELVTGLETELGWEHCDAEPQRGRRKREWRVKGGHGDIFAVIEVYPTGESVRFAFGTNFIPQSPLTSERRAIGGYSFVTPSKEFIQELLMCKVNSGNLKKDRIQKLKIDARVLMTDDEYAELCARLDGMKN